MATTQGIYVISTKGNTIKFRPISNDELGGQITFGLGNATITINTKHIPTKELIVPITGESNSSKILGKKSPYDFKKWFMVGSNVTNETTTICGTSINNKPPLCTKITYPKGDFKFFEFNGGEVIENDYCSQFRCDRPFYRVARGASGFNADDMVIMDNAVGYENSIPLIFVLNNGGVSVFTYRNTIGFTSEVSQSQVISETINEEIKDEAFRDVKEISSAGNSFFVRCGGGIALEFRVSYNYSIQYITKHNNVSSVLNGEVHIFHNTYAKNTDGTIVPYDTEVIEPVYVDNGTLYYGNTVKQTGVTGGGLITVGGQDKENSCYYETDNASPEFKNIINENTEPCGFNWAGKGDLGNVVGFTQKSPNDCGRVNW